MLRSHLLRAFVLLAAVTAGGATAYAQPATETPTFRARVDLACADGRGDGRGRMRGLRPRDFVVLERGRPRSIGNFKAGDQGPVSLAILMDTSGSMRVGRQLSASRDAIEHVLSWIDSSTDEIGLFSFDQTLASRCRSRRTRRASGTGWPASMGWARPSTMRSRYAASTSGRRPAGL